MTLQRRAVPVALAALAATAAAVRLGAWRDAGVVGRARAGGAGRGGGLAVANAGAVDQRGQGEQEHRELRHAGQWLHPEVALQRVHEGAIALPGTPQDFGTLIAREIPRGAAVVKAGNVRPE